MPAAVRADDADEIKELRSEIKALEQKLDALERREGLHDQAAAPAVASAPEAVPVAPSTPSAPSAAPEIKIDDTGFTFSSADGDTFIKLADSCRRTAPVVRR